MLVERDPFGRVEIHRERIYDEHATCDWCGGQRVTYVLGRRYLFEYRIESDGGRLHVVPNLFCSNQCWRAYTH